jgi:hypothetical protein
LSSSEIFSTVAATKDVKFKDLDQLQSQVASLLEFDEEFEEGAPVIAFEDGLLKLRGYEDEQPEEYAETYGCFGMNGAKLVSTHLISGRILVRLQPEGWPEQLILVTPGKAEEVDVAKLLGF